MKTLRNIFAENMRAIRQMKNISQEELGFLSGLHRTYISGIERSTRNVSIDNIEKIASALEINPDILFDGVKSREFVNGEREKAKQ